MIKVSVSLFNHLDEIVSDLGTRSKVKITQRVAEQVAEIARDMAPVDTGRLRGSIDVQRDGNNHAVVTDVPYAPFIEFGTTRMPAQPFLGPAAETVRLSHFDIEDTLR